MFAPAYLVTPSVAYPLPTANYPQHYVRASAAWQSLDHRNLYWLERIGNVVAECPVWRLDKLDRNWLRVFYQTPDGYRYNRVIRSSKYLFIRQAVIVQVQTLLMLMLALITVPALPPPDALPMLPPPRVNGLLPARAESACKRRDGQTHHIVWATTLKPQETALAPRADDTGRNHSGNLGGMHTTNRETVRAFLSALDPTSEFDRDLAQQFQERLKRGRANFTPRPLFE
jgi:hypothetical protein